MLEGAQGRQRSEPLDRGFATMMQLMRVVFCSETAAMLMNVIVTPATYTVLTTWVVRWNPSVCVYSHTRAYRHVHTYACIATYSIWLVQLVQPQAQITPRAKLTVTWNCANFRQRFLTQLALDPFPKDEGLRGAHGKLTTWMAYSMRKTPETPQSRAQRHCMQPIVQQQGGKQRE